MAKSLLDDELRVLAVSDWRQPKFLFRLSQAPIPPL